MAIIFVYVTTNKPEINEINTFVISRVAYLTYNSGKEKINFYRISTVKIH